MSRNAHEDHERFQRIADRYAACVLRDFPDAAKRDWIVGCWQSFKTFVKMFPTSLDRDNAIEALAKNDALANKALDQCNPILWDLSVDKAPNSLASDLQAAHFAK